MASATLSPDAINALTEALVTAESVEAIAVQLIENASSSSYPLLEAIVACAQRCRSAVKPVMEAAKVG